MKNYSLFRHSVVLAATMVRADGQVPVQFDAATIRMIQMSGGPGDPLMTGGPGTSWSGRVTWRKARLDRLLATAFQVDPMRVSGPGWMNGIGAPLYAFNAVMPPDTTQSDFERMMQAFLVEQFKIKFHHEPKLFPGYDLVLAPGGPKLQLSADPTAPDMARYPPKVGPDGFPVLPPGHGKAMNNIHGHHATFQNYTMAELADFLMGLVSGERLNYVLDKTNLTGRYDFKLKFEGDARTAIVGLGVQAALGTRDAPEPGSNLPDLFKAIQQQLGLRLVKVKDISLDTIVIDHTEKMPVGN